MVFPKSSTPGAYERYVLRVPNERAVATTRVELHFPAEVKVSSFGDVAGWKLEVVRDSAKRIVGATWTGTLEAERFVEFPFVAVNPKVAAKISWPAFQTYADGERVEWTGAEGSTHPASATTVASAAAAVAATSSGGTNQWIAITALVLAVISIGLALRPSSIPSSS
jgi:uncharacterized protein YcnI